MLGATSVPSRPREIPQNYPKPEERLPTGLPSSGPGTAALPRFPFPSPLGHKSNLRDNGLGGQLVLGV